MADDPKCPCGKAISRREERLDAGLCDACFAEALRATALEVAARAADG